MRQSTINGKALVVFAWALLLLSPAAQAQFSKARLQAIGLTCALCSKAIHEALSQLPFVDSVRADIKSSAFDIQFKSGATIPVDAMKASVEESGFFVGGLSLKLSRSLSDPERADHLFRQEGYTYRLLEDWKDGSALQVVGRGYMTEKDFKKISAPYADRLAGDPKSVFLLPKNK